MTSNTLTKHNSNQESLNSTFNHLDHHTDIYNGDRITLYQAYLLSRLLRSHPTLSVTTRPATSD